ncbi:MAG: substrate-binding domain-containing protein [Anaerolineales bacterium]|nr:substrate-binding domain-containing protein [Anaerolineales bacterium]
MNKIYRFRLVLLVVFMLILPFSACSQKPSTQQTGQLEGTITISGAFALYPMMQRWAEEFQTINPGVQFDISAGGAGKGMTDAVSGAVDIGMVSRSIKPEEEAQGAYGVAVVKDAVFPTVNANNPVLSDILAKGITQETFVKIYITGEITTWGQVVGKPEITDEIHVYTRSDAAGAPEMWAKFLGKLQEDLLGIGVNGDPGLLDAVIKDPLGIGFNNLGYAYDLASGQPVTGAVVAPIDINNNSQADADELYETMPEAMQAVATGKYPSPPARPLNVVTKDKPSGLVQVFIRWILTDGQQFVGEAGYVQLPPEQLAESLNKVK